MRQPAIRICLLLVFVVVLASCTTPSSPLPPYIVKLTQSYNAGGMCTGSLIDEHHILTAAHCQDLGRAVTQSGLESRIKSRYRWRLIDVAIMETERPLPVSQYATVAAAGKGPARIVGLCPFYLEGSPRYATYVGKTVLISETTGKIRLHDSWLTRKWMGDRMGVCGGDSGGVVIQNGNVVGVTSAVESESFLAVWGSFFYTASGEGILARLQSLGLQ